MAQTRNKRSLTIARHRTSVTLEDAFWEALGDIARAEGKSVAALVKLQFHCQRGNHVVKIAVFEVQFADAFAEDFVVSLHGQLLPSRG